MVSKLREERKYRQFQHLNMFVLRDWPSNTENKADSSRVSIDSLFDYFVFHISWQHLTALH